MPARRIVFSIRFSLPRGKQSGIVDCLQQLVRRGCRCCLESVGKQRALRTLRSLGSVRSLTSDGCVALGVDYSLLLREVCRCKGTTFGRGRQKKVAHNEVFNFLRVDKGVVCGVEVAKWSALGGAHRLFFDRRTKGHIWGTQNARTYTEFLVARKEGKGFKGAEVLGRPQGFCRDARFVRQHSAW